MLLLNCLALLSKLGSTLFILRKFLLQFAPDMYRGFIETLKFVDLEVLFVELIVLFFIELSRRMISVSVTS